MSEDTEPKLSASVVFGVSDNSKFKAKFGLRQRDHAILISKDMQCFKNRTQKPLTLLPSEPDHFWSVPGSWETKQRLALVTLAFDWLLNSSFT